MPPNPVSKAGAAAYFIGSSMPRAVSVLVSRTVLLQSNSRQWKIRLLV